MNKKKIINDPVYGFITLQSELIFDIISHPYFQRLRHIKQLGLTDLVYPGALHTRFQHALGALHLMGKALDTLRAKGTEVSAVEYEASQLAILLHDIGHGPFSHALEDSLLHQVSHESLSYLFMDKLNADFGGALDTALKIFRNSYPRKFFHQLVSSQLDIDRLDYLKRDSFFAGVPEGNVGVERILAMLVVKNDNLLVEQKGIYSIESFLTARRVMYWQVYLHKTTVSAERMLVNLIRRAQILARAGEPLMASNALAVFLKREITLSDFGDDPAVLDSFGQLDDNDIWGAVKCWKNHSDGLLARLSTMLTERQLFQIKLSADPIRKNQIEQICSGVMKHFRLLRSEAPYLFSHGVVSNEAYAVGKEINILMRSGEILDVAQASDLPHVSALSKIVKKNYLCWPKNVSL